ncbi:hypothetical protein AB0M45_31085 [Nocardia sp. NPDC051787]
MALTVKAAHLRRDGPGEVTLDDIRALTSTSKRQIFHVAVIADGMSV